MKSTYGQVSAYMDPCLYIIQWGFLTYLFSSLSRQALCAQVNQSECFNEKDQVNMFCRHAMKQGMLKWEEIFMAETLLWGGKAI